MRMGGAMLKSSVYCHRCFNARHCCQTCSSAVCQFAQHTGEIIPAAASSTDTIWAY